MLAESILVKSGSTSTGENLTMKFSSQPGEIAPAFGIIVKGPASRIPLILLTILKLYSKAIKEVFLIVNFIERVAYIKVGLKSIYLVAHSQLALSIIQLVFRICYFGAPSKISTSGSGMTSISYTEGSSDMSITTSSGKGAATLVGGFAPFLF